MTSVTTPQCKKSLDVFQIPSFKGLISDCYKLEGTGKMTVDLASPAHSSSSLFFPRFFFFFFERGIPEWWTISPANNHRTSL